MSVRVSELPKVSSGDEGLEAQVPGPVRSDVPVLIDLVSEISAFLYLMSRVCDTNTCVTG